MAIHYACWRRLIDDWESLSAAAGQIGSVQSRRFMLIWSSQLPVGSHIEPNQIKWIWLQFPDESLKTRLDALALRGAKELGQDSKEGWFNELRAAPFVQSTITGGSLSASESESEWRLIDDVVKESITLCHLLEAGCGAPSSGFPKESSLAELTKPPTTVVNKRGKRGPTPNYAMASRVAAIVEGTGDDWRENLDEVLMALDDAKIPTPKTWCPRHGYKSWYAAAMDDTARGRHLAIEVIVYRLKLAKENPKETIA
jgi:hypothetical protein